MSKIHVIDGKKYVEVNRKAEVGEKIIVIKDTGYFKESHVGEIHEVTSLAGTLAFTTGKWDDGSTLNLTQEEYRVLEPIEESPDVTDLLANLARRVLSLEQLLTDTQRNVEQLAQELATIKHDIDDKVEMMIDDIVLLDERTQTEQADVVTFNKFLEDVADRVAEKLVKGGER